jgi:5-methyltetrahydrofolate--homocysteine methyltransferase
LLIETSQDLLQTKAAVNGCKQAIVTTGIRVPIFVEVTVELTGTMLMGSEIAAALTTLEPLGIDMIGLNCATGPAEMSEHLRHLSKFSHLPVVCMPNAGLPVLGAHGASYPLTPDELATAHEQFAKEFGLGMVGGCCGTTPAHLKAVVDRIGGTSTVARVVEEDSGVASLYQHVPFTQDASYLAIGERTNANGSRAFRDAMLDERWDDCVDIARNQVREGAHLLDVCIDYVGRDGVADMKPPARRRLDRACGAAGRNGTHRRTPGRQLGQLRRRRRSRLALRPDHATREGARRRRHRTDHRRRRPGSHRREQGSDR